LSLLCGFGDSVDIECKYVTESYDAVFYVYQCMLQNTLNIKSRESTVINSVNGSHKSGYSNADVICFYSSSFFRVDVIEYFPRNLENIFTNLKMILIQNGRLKEIQQSDLKPFAKLVHLSLARNDIEFLEDGLFAYNPELEYVSFWDNKIIHIGIQVFDHLKELAWLWLKYNTCISISAKKNRTAVIEVISQTKVKCINDEYLSIDNEIKVFEENLFCPNSEALLVLKQNFKNLQRRTKKSKFSESWSFSKRFEALEILAMQNNTSVKDKMCKMELSAKKSKLEILDKIYSNQDKIHRDMNNIESDLYVKISTLEDSITNLTSMIHDMQKASTTDDLLMIFMIGSSAIICIIYVVLIIDSLKGTKV
jgi:ABC-type antimicrobial peptide transport system permease subunit